MTGIFEAGPTGDYPAGKMTDDDEGGLNIAIGGVDGWVVVEFDKHVGGIALMPVDARDLARILTEKADALEGEGGAKVEADYPIRLHEVMQEFEVQADSAHERALESTEVAAMSIYAGKEQVWRAAKQHVGEVFGDVIGAAENDGEWTYGDEIDFGKVQVDLGKDRVETGPVPSPAAEELEAWSVPSKEPSDDKRD